jgi:hypothetical protein
VQRVSKPHPPIDGELEAAARLWGISVYEARRVWDNQSKRCTFWEDDTYQVRVKPVKFQGPATHQIIIRRKDLGVVENHWQEFMRIKDAVLGPEWEAVELYPSSYRRYDTSNTYHLWATLSPFGFGYWGLNA